jgi:hypothetical protein
MQCGANTVHYTHWSDKLGFPILSLPFWIKDSSNHNTDVGWEHGGRSRTSTSGPFGPPAPAQLYPGWPAHSSTGARCPRQSLPTTSAERRWSSSTIKGLGGVSESFLRSVENAHQLSALYPTPILFLSPLVCSSPIRSQPSPSLSVAG